jgi:predicted AAA+ superfamily ATPase
MIDDKKYYIFFDEIQLVEHWEKTVNGLRLKNTDIYITGSNSKVKDHRHSRWLEEAPLKGARN